MDDFKNLSDHNNLIDIPTKGFLLERILDRDFCNPNWLTLNSIMNVSTLNKVRPDHYLIILEVSFSQHKHASSFKLLNVLTLHDRCEDFVAKFWYILVIGCPTYILRRKLQLLKTSLKSLYK